MTQGSVNVKYQISPYYVFFLIHSMQIGAGVLSFQRMLAKATGADGWISILLAGVLVHVLIWIIYKIFSLVPGDITFVNTDTLGKWFGNIINLLFIIYFFMLSNAVLSTYINVVHVWMFEDITSWGLAAIFFGLMYYIISGGFRTITGITFLSVILSYWLLFVLFYALQYSDFYHLLPMFTHSLLDILKGTKDSTFNFIGFDMLLMFYPFIKNAETSQKFAHWGTFATTCLVLFFYLVTLVFYSVDQLILNIWPTLTMVSIVELPFLERFEYIEISWWALVVTPNMTIPLWAASRAFKQVFHIQQKYVLWVMGLIIVAPHFFFLDKEIIPVLNKLVVNLGYVLFLYLSVLLIIIYLKKKMRNKL
ncbi:GerAB/ArcD/ProY family transporter [Peribacillus asahii]|uniref:GerAB/ArcD/ProY family transporter n=1 Tax=Peribacillus asahii TaxID=228899 RepID=UPI002079ABB8|nr:GerAB/ArcD/ProY family transporter [Peribacillus asahii]USK69531.1 spore germination protein [Peribacillus asahii]